MKYLTRYSLFFIVSLIAGFTVNGQSAEDFNGKLGGLYKSERGSEIQDIYEF